MDQYISEKNKKFLETLGEGSKYEIQEEMDENLYYVTNEEGEELMMKLVNIEENKQSINLIIDGIRSIYHVLRNCEHKDRFICYRDFFTDMKSIVIVYDKEEGMDLFEYNDLYYNEGEKIPFHEIIDIGHTLFHSLKILHDYGICHRDIKPSNIIYSEDNPLKVKIIDFDFCCNISDGLCSGNPGTVAYAASSVLKNPNPDWKRCDIVSLAITLFRLFTGDIDYVSYFSQKISNREQWIREKYGKAMDERKLKYGLFLVDLFYYDINKSEKTMDDILDDYQKFIL